MCGRGGGGGIRGRGKRKEGKGGRTLPANLSEALGCSKRCDNKLAPYAAISGRDFFARTVPTKCGVKCAHVPSPTPTKHGQKEGEER